MTLTDGIKNKLKAIADAIREKNGTDTQYQPSKMASAIDELKVGELDFEGIYKQEQADEINQYYKAGIDTAKEIAEILPTIKISLTDYFKNKNIPFYPNIELKNTNSARLFRDSICLLFADYRNVAIDANISGLFETCYSLMRASIYAPYTKYAQYAFINCRSLIEAKIELGLNPISLYQFAYGCKWLTTLEFNYMVTTDLKGAFQDCPLLQRIIGVIDIQSSTIFTGAFYSCNELENINLKGWMQVDISFSYSSKLTPESIHYIIQNAIDVAEGATARTLTLHATAKTNWQNSEYYEQDLAVLEQKGITIA